MTGTPTLTCSPLPASNRGKIRVGVDLGTAYTVLVVLNENNIPIFEEAKALKKDPKEQTRLFPVIRPVMEKVTSIINRHIEGFRVDKLYLVGVTYAYPGMDEVIQEMTGIETILPGNPLFVTPLGIAMHNN